MKRVLYVVLVLTVLAIGAATAQDRAPYFDHHASYLALGDSIPFGFNPFVPLTPPPPNLLHYYHGYPPYVSEFLKLDLANASCPGQTSSSFLGFPPDNGCNQYRSAQLPLFVTYAPLETQKEYAVSFLAAHRDTRLATITIGGDDLLILLKTCGSSVSCIETDLPGVLATFTTNLTEIYVAIRSTGYEGPIVAVNYASSDYNNALETQALSQLNSAMLKVTESFNGKVADAFSAFEKESVVVGGLPCEVGLSFFNASGTGCDVHPTPWGQLVIAKLVLHALKEDRFPVDLSRLYENH